MTKRERRARPVAPGYGGDPERVALPVAARAVAARARRYVLWAWPAYVVVAIGIFFAVSRGSGGTLQRDAIFFGFLFGVLGIALLKAFVDPVLRGLAARRSKTALAEELVVDVAKTGAEIAVTTVLDAALGGGASSSSGSSS